MIYRILTETRKTVVGRFRELAGGCVRYTYMPRCAFEGKGISIEKDYRVITQENADPGIIRTLIEEGLIAPVEEEQTGQTASRVEEAAATVSESADETRSVSGEGEKGGADGLTISLPVSGHTENSLRNLIFMIYSRGDLLSKATGGAFGVDQALIEKLKGGNSQLNADGSGLRGLKVTGDRISFTGFPMTEDPADIQVFMQLASAMNKAALNRKRIHPKKTHEENEKYSLRTWLVGIGMGGPEYSAARKRLMRGLSGHSAFRTEADKERWMERRKHGTCAGSGC